MLSKERGKYFQEKWDEMEYKFANMEMKQQIIQLTNNWNELEEWVESEYNRYLNDTENLIHSNIETIDYSRMLNKMKEIKEGNNVSR